jgi:hypothetical protein
MQKTVTLHQAQGMPMRSKSPDQEHPVARNLSIARWWDMTRLGLLGALITICFWKLTLSHVVFWAELLSTVPFAVLAFCPLALLALFLAPQHFANQTQNSGYWPTQLKAWRSALGVGSYWRYPPTSVAGLIGTSLLCVFMGGNQNLKNWLGLDHGSRGFYFGAAALCALCVAFVLPCLSWILGKLAIRKLEQSKADASSGPLITRGYKFRDFSELRRWIKNDNPVETPQGDALDHRLIAERIASRLQQDPPPAMAVLGALGSGKTTLGHFVKTFLEVDGSRVELIQIELWPYRNAEAAAQGILQALLDALARWASTLNLKGLPGRIEETLSAAGGWWNVLSKLRPPEDITTSLKRIDNIAKAVDRRFVFWIEDLERFASDPLKTGSSDSDKQWERVQPLVALLNSIDKMHSVTVVIATTHLSIGSDPEKIVRYIEELPIVSREVKAKILSEFRLGCRELYKDLIDPNPSIRKHLDRLSDISMLDRSYYLRSSGDTDNSDKIVDAILELCDSPRKLKAALRRTLDFWGWYPGEINFDHLLVASMALVNDQNAFSALEEFRPQILQQSTNSIVGATSSLKSKLVEIVVSDAARRAYITVADFLFYATDQRGGQTFSRQTNRHDFYWNLFLAEPEILEDQKDQRLLKTLRDGSDQDIVNLLSKDQQRDQLIDFRSLLIPDRIKTISELLISDRTHETPSEAWRSNTHPTGGITFSAPGMDLLKELWRRAIEDGSTTRDDARELIQKTLPRAIESNWSLFIELNEFASALMFDSAGELDDLIYRHFRDVCLKGPKTVIDALRNQSTRALGLLLNGSGIRYAGGTLPSDWDSVAENLMDALSMDPKTCLPAFGGLLVTVNMGNSELDFMIDQVLLKHLFGDAKRLLHVLAMQNPDEWVSSNAKVHTLITYASAVSKKGP